MEQNLSAQLRDIKPLLEIPDHTFYLYWGIIGTSVLLGIVIVFFLIKKFWKKRTINLEKGYLEKLNTISWDNTKQDAYNATYYGRLLATDERKRELFYQLEIKLEKYKYKKEVDNIDEETRNQFNLYVQVANESV